MELKIPNYIDVISQHIDVYIDNTLDDLGEYSPNENHIKLKKEHEGVKLAKDKVNLVFFHEVTHAILDGIGEEELYVDEKFVEKFSNVLYQVIKQL